MNLIKKVRKLPDGSTQYDVFHKGVKVAEAGKGWMNPGGEQYIAKMPNKAPFGNQSLKGLMKDIEKKLLGT